MAEGNPDQAHDTPAEPAPLPRTARSKRSRHRGAVEQVRDVHFPIVLRGYDRAAVDEHIARVAQLVAELEATQLRENVVQKALDEVGEQTAGILQRAHETAEEIAARSRAQAEGRIQRAEREAELTRQEAARFAREVAADTRRIWEERRRLIEDMRQFADDVLSVADDALERLPPPVPVEAAADEGSPEPLEEQPGRFERPTAAEGSAARTAEEPPPDEAPTQVTPALGASAAARERQRPPRDAADSARDGQERPVEAGPLEPETGPPGP